MFSCKYTSKKVLWISVCQYLLQLLWPTHTMHRNIWSSTKTLQSNSIYGVVAAWFRQGTLSIDCLKGLADQGQWLSCEVATSCKNLQETQILPLKTAVSMYLLFVYLGVVLFSILLKIAFTNTSTLLNCTWKFKPLATEVRLQELTHQLCILQIQEHCACCKGSQRSCASEFQQNSDEQMASSFTLVFMSPGGSQPLALCSCNMFLKREKQWGISAIPENRK